MDSFLDFLVHTKGWLRPDQAAAVPRHLTGPALDRHLIEQGLLRPGHVRRARLDQDAQLTFEVGSAPESVADSGPANAATVRSPRPAPTPEDATRTSREPPGQVVANVAIERVAARRARSVTYVGRLVESKKSAFLRDGALVDADEALVAAWLMAPLPEACNPTDRVANYLDKGRSGAGLWISREFVDGRPLADVIAGGALKPDQVERLAVDVLVGLAALHQIGSIHGRLHAGNVILSSRSGRPRLVDHSLGDFVRLVETRDAARGAVAPEVRGGADPSSRSDMWRFGVLLCEMLAGMVVPEGATATGRTDVASVVAEGVRKLEEGPFRDLVVACVSDDPMQRPFNGRAALQRVRVADSRAARSSEGSSSAPPLAEPPVPEVAESVGRGRRWWAVAVSVVALAGLGVVIPIYFLPPTEIVADDHKVSEIKPCATLGDEGNLVASKEEPNRPVVCGKEGCGACSQVLVRYENIIRARILRKQMRDAKSPEELLAGTREAAKGWIGARLVPKELDAIEKVKHSLVARWLDTLADESKRKSAREDFEALAKVVELESAWTVAALDQLAGKVTGWRDGSLSIDDGSSADLRTYLPQDLTKDLEIWRKLDSDCASIVDAFNKSIVVLDSLEHVKHAQESLDHAEREAGSWKERANSNQKYSQARQSLLGKVAQVLGHRVAEVKREVDQLESPLVRSAAAESPRFDELLPLMEHPGSASALPHKEEWQRQMSIARKRLDDWRRLHEAAGRQWADVDMFAQLLAPYANETGPKIDEEGRRKALAIRVPVADESQLSVQGFENELEQLNRRAKVLGNFRSLALALRALGDFGQLPRQERNQLIACLERAASGDFDEMEQSLENLLKQSKQERVGDGFAFTKVRDARRRGANENDEGPLMLLVPHTSGGTTEYFYVDQTASGYNSDSFGKSLELAGEWLIKERLIGKLGNQLSAAAGPEIFQPEEAVAARRDLLCVWCSESPGYKRFLERAAVEAEGFKCRRIRRLSATQ